MLPFVFVLFLLGFLENAESKSRGCPKDFIQIGEKCYLFNQSKVKWDTAYFQCQAKNSTLATFTTAKEEQLLRSYLNSHVKTLGQHTYWIGGKFNWKQGKWIWAASGNPLEFHAFSKSLPPEKKLRQWACTVIDPYRYNKWTFRSCLEEEYFICETNLRIKKKFKASVCKKTNLTEFQKHKCLKLFGGYGGIMFKNIPAPIIQTPRPTNSSKPFKQYVCPSNMFVVKRKCYFFSHTKLSWNEAYWACRENKTQLAIIQNREQDKLLREILKNELVESHERWIGGLYDWKQRKWRWGSSGKIIKYKNFAKSLPKEKIYYWEAITLNPKFDFQWSSDLQTKSKYFICQKKAKTVMNLGDVYTGTNYVLSE